MTATDATESAASNPLAALTGQTGSATERGLPLPADDAFKFEAIVNTPDECVIGGAAGKPAPASNSNPAASPGNRRRAGIPSP